MKISVVINTYNASKYLRQVLESAKSFDEIVVCDMESTDETISISHEYNCKIITFKKGTYNIVEPARNFAIQQASHPWVLVVDADEVISEDLRNYLYEKIQRPDCPAGIYIPRKNYFMGRFMHCHYPDHILRFFKKEVTTWPPIIHAFPLVQGPLYAIPAKRKELAFIHLANDSMSDIVKKTNVYTQNEVEKRRNKKYGFLAFFYRPCFRFFKAYCLKGGIRDGKEGFIKSCLEGYYQFIMLAKITENTKN
ncbi:MAG: glycosyltransferase family 2 protein [Bacteroidales bacterium]